MCSLVNGPKTKHRQLTLKMLASNFFCLKHENKFFALEGIGLTKDLFFHNNKLLKVSTSNYPARPG